VHRGTSCKTLTALNVLISVQSANLLTLAALVPPVITWTTTNSASAAQHNYPTVNSALKWIFAPNVWTEWFLLPITHVTLVEI